MSRVDEWNKIITERLGDDAFDVDEPGYVRPTASSIERARQIAMSCRDQGEKPPARIIPDGDGGISFEWYDKYLSENVDVDDTGVAVRDRWQPPERIESCMEIKKG